MAALKVPKKVLLAGGAFASLAIPLAAGWLTASTAAAQVVDYEPVVKVAPEYPSEAALGGLEGFVILEFTVNETGGVVDPIVIESSDEIFEQPSIDAALKFKYRPRVVNGQPVIVPYVRNRIVYSLEQPESDAASEGERDAN